MTWTQPVCDACWREREGERGVYRLREPDVETCCYCGASTASGIYVRVDPATVPHPAQDT